MKTKTVFTDTVVNKVGMKLLGLEDTYKLFERCWYM